MPHVAQSDTIKTGMITGLFMFAAIVVAAAIITIISKNSSAEGAAVTDFATCVASGKPILATYPEQCIGPNGHSYTRP